MLRTALAVVLFLCALPLAAATVWDGPDLAFSKAPRADPLNPLNQDRLTDNVILTRGSIAGLFNAATETSFDRGTRASPAGTRWAFRGLFGNPIADFSAAAHARLNFDTWADALGGDEDLVANILSRPAVVHLVEDDIYLDLTFTSWGVGPLAGGRFAYVRSTPSAVPLPAPLLLLGSGLGWLAASPRARARRASVQS